MARQKRWRLLSPAPFQQMASLPNMTPLMVQILHHRGLREPEEVEAFLSAGDSLVGDPLLLPDMELAMARIDRAIQRGEVVAVYGDFDVDGVAGTALLSLFLSRQGIKVIPYLPHRTREGYGLNAPALEHLRQEGAQLVITVDCGTTAIQEARQATALGLDVIITDHHSVPPALPPALAVVNPRREDSSYPYPHLSGVGVAYKLAQALGLALPMREGGRGSVEDYLDLAALGTIVDMVPLTGENRFLARRGLEALNSSPRLGLQELMRSARLTPGRVDAETVSYTIGPRLNSAGRLDHALASFRLLTTDSLQEAREIAGVLEAQNARRQALTAEALELAREKARHLVPHFPLLMVGSRDFPAGVIGLVASRLAEEFYRPAVVVEVGEVESRGSARSIPQFDIHAALAQCSHLLSRFGGHPQAAGFTVANENLGLLRQMLLDLAEKELSSVEMEPSIAIDAQVELGQLDWDAMRFIQRLEPFGKGNPAPIFLSRAVRVVDRRVVGGGSNSLGHLRLKLHDGKLTWPAVAFGLGGAEGLEVDSRVDVVYHLVVDAWDGGEVLQLEIEDVRPSGRSLS